MVTVKILEDGFSVANNGDAIEKEHEDTIFEPHFSTKEDGYGLGLTLVRDLLKTIGGKVRLLQGDPVVFKVVFR